MEKNSPAATRRTRRMLLGAGIGLLVAGCAHGANKTESKEAEVAISPGEDLMREHGVLRRVLLVYDESVRRLDAGEPLPLEALTGSAGLVRQFVEDYHERLEEEFVFPAFAQAGPLAELVAVLRQQHQRGRQLTDEVMRLASATGPLTQPDRAELTQALRLYVRMYQPHAAREDTELFPAFRKLVGERQYAALGEQFEGRERTLFGAGGFERAVQDVARLERMLGIEDLVRFTPPAVR